MIPGGCVAHATTGSSVRDTGPLAAHDHAEFVRAEHGRVLDSVAVQAVPDEFVTDEGIQEEFEGFELNRVALREGDDGDHRHMAIGLGEHDHQVRHAAQTGIGLCLLDGFGGEGASGTVGG